MNYNIYIVVILTLTILGCAKKQQPGEVFLDSFYSHTGIKVLSEDIKVVDYEKNYSIGDHVESIKVEIDSVKIEIILSELINESVVEKVNDSVYQFVSSENQAQNTIILFYPKRRTIKLTEVNL